MENAIAVCTKHFHNFSPFQFSFRLWLGHGARKSWSLLSVVIVGSESAQAHGTKSSDILSHITRAFALSVSSQLLTLTFSSQLSVAVYTVGYFFSCFWLLSSVDSSSAVKWNWNKHTIFQPVIYCSTMMSSETHKFFDARFFSNCRIQKHINQTSGEDGVAAKM